MSAGESRTERVLITGGRGLLGREIAEAFHDRFELRVTDREECDVTNLPDCRREIGAFHPQVAIHCAAYTAVDRAEAEPEQAYAVNAAGTGNMARACRERGILLVTFGTDYVFDGASSRPYREEDPVRPLSVYGKSKLAAEEALRDAGTEHLLVRTQWLYGAAGRNFVLTILEKARRGETLRVASDQTGSPTYARDLAEAVRKLLDAGARGTFHFSNEGETTWYGFAGYVLERSGLSEAPLLPAASRDLPYPARRPAYSVLCKKKYRGITGESPRPWKEAADDFLGHLVGKGGR
ncbi:MAG TPA: dTDP-4-dehydrorhamnose reductase [Candidatus Deferrimicrobiaceae bacterium]